MKRTFPIGCIAVLISLLAGSSAVAAIRPSFSLDDSAWIATDIVVVEQQDKGVVVHEAWKGNLPAGTVLDIKGLPPAPVDVASWDRAAPHGKVSGKRIVLFLKTAAAKDGTIHWVGAEFAGQPWASAVWFDGGKAYAFEQQINPGPSLLWPTEWTEAEFKKQTEKFLAAKQTYQQALAITDPSKRADALLPMIQSDDWELNHAAMSSIGACGAPAVPMLRKLVLEYGSYADLLAKSLAQAAGDRAGPVMTDVLKDNLAFWQTQAQTLPGNWWNQLMPDDLRESARDHYLVLEPALAAIASAHYAPARDTIDRLVALWKSTPHLHLEYDRPDPILDDAATTLDTIERPATRPVGK
jgi:hypothetical protein